MKYLFQFIAFLFIVNNSPAQDTIIKRSGEMVISKVLEITSIEVKYKRYNFIDGPTYTDLKSSISAIRYANGFKEEFQLEKLIVNDAIEKEYADLLNLKIEKRGAYLYHLNKKLSTKDLTKLMMASNNKNVINLSLKSQRAKRLRNIGYAAIPFVFAGAFSGMFALANFDGGDGTFASFSGGCFLIAIPISITGIINSCNHTVYKREMIKVYNEKY